MRFSSETTYGRLWETLFFFEAKAQILRSKVEEATPPEAVEFINFAPLNKFKLFNFKKILVSSINYNMGTLVVISPPQSSPWLM